MYRLQRRYRPGLHRASVPTLFAEAWTGEEGSNMTPPHDRFRAALASLPRPGGNGYHPRLLGVANIGIRAGIPPANVIDAIRTHTPEGGRRVSDQEITDAVAKASRDTLATPRRVFKSATRWHNPRRAPRSFNAAAFMAARLAEGEDFGEVDILEASPVRIDWPPEQDAEKLLACLYKPDDVIFIGDQYGRAVRSVADWLADFRAGQSIPPHIIPNPLTGLKAVTKDGKPSFRADACVKSFRFALAEFDTLPREDQLRFWWAVNLPVVALIDSGNKSFHAWIRIDDVSTAAAWDSQVEGQLFGRYLIPLGCDSACRNEGRMSRMPGHYRAETKRWQRILYLAPGGRRVKP